MIKPLHDRVLVRPIVPPVSDLIVAPDDHYEPEQMGEVVALGTGSLELKQAVHRALEAVIDRLGAAFADSLTVDMVRSFLIDARDGYQPEPSCPVGTVVCFAPKHGYELNVDGEAFLMLREDDLLAVVEPVSA